MAENINAILSLLVMGKTVDTDVEIYIGLHLPGNKNLNLFKKDNFGFE